MRTQDDSRDDQPATYPASGQRPESSDPEAAGDRVPDGALSDGGTFEDPDVPGAPQDPATGAVAKPVFGTDLESTLPDDGDRTGPDDGHTALDEAAERRADEFAFHEPAPVPTAFGATTVGSAVAASAMAGSHPSDDRRPDHDRRTDAASGVADDRLTTAGQADPDPIDLALDDDTGSTTRTDDAARRDPADSATSPDRPDTDRLNADRLNADRLNADRLNADRLDADRPDADRFDAGGADDRSGAGSVETADHVDTDRPDDDRLDVDRPDTTFAGSVTADHVDINRLGADQPDGDDPADRSGAEHVDTDQLDDQPQVVRSGAVAVPAADHPVDDVSAVVAEPAVPGQVPSMVPAAAVGPLFDDGQAHQLRDRWRDVQFLFVDDPKAAAHEARGLVDEAVDSLTATLRSQRDGLGGADTEDTEQLRILIRRYRDFLDRLLGL